MNLTPRLLVLLAIIAAILGACVGATPTVPSASAPSSPSAAAATAAPTLATTPAPSSIASPIASTNASPSGPAATPPSQTDTSWGRIWDALPASFPRFPGSEPTVTGSGAASAVVQLPTDVTNGAKWYRTALEAAGYATDGMNGPLEDGSIVIDSHGAMTGCRVRASVAPLGGRTIATIMFGSNCPFS
ncbi:MAG TPA: hypothetical protein VNF73_16250 [Candidatus Saccharimonadales bacterium]|nr:hypothetical protein [Candidatus Saccharimonadales bacterium]